jgi:hypothetical protein
MPETVLSALGKFAPRCMECGRLATYGFNPPSNLSLWVMKYGPFTRLVPGEGVPLDLGHGKDADWEVVKEFSQEWVRELDALGLGEGVPGNIITYQYTRMDSLYLCDEHHRMMPWMVELPYTHFIRTGEVIPSYPTRFERMMTPDA